MVILAAALAAGSAASERQRSVTVSHVPRQATLGLHLARFPEAVEAALADLKPNHIADYAFNLAGHYNSFYADCQARPPPRRPHTGRGAC
jgi:arginyl-tRNA synthetase